MLRIPILLSVVFTASSVFVRAAQPVRMDDSVIRSEAYGPEAQKRADHQGEAYKKKRAAEIIIHTKKRLFYLEPYWNECLRRIEVRLSAKLERKMRVGPPDRRQTIRLYKGAAATIRRINDIRNAEAEKSTDISMRQNYARLDIKWRTLKISRESGNLEGVFRPRTWLHSWEKTTSGELPRVAPYFEIHEIRLNADGKGHWIGVYATDDPAIVFLRKYDDSARILGETVVTPHCYGKPLKASGRVFPLIM